MQNRRFPNTLPDLPAEYVQPVVSGGSLVNVEYDTYESFSYEEKTTVLHKRAVAYLPAGYDETKRYNVLYLMHGGWSDETVYLGSPETGDGPFKNVLDHAMKNGEMTPMIVVCPTYNNLSPKDSWDYSLAIRLTENYHNELEHDLIPAAISKFSTYAEDTSLESIVKSRDHRGFAGFSMGSVTTFRTMEYNLNAFRYFQPSSGNIGAPGSVIADWVRRQGYGPDDLVLFTATGTKDFAYAAFRSQIYSMASEPSGTFRLIDENGNGNLLFLEKKGAEHDGLAAMTYFYHGLCTLWQSEREGS